LAAAYGRDETQRKKKKTRKKKPCCATVLCNVFWHWLLCSCDPIACGGSGCLAAKWGGGICHRGRFGTLNFVRTSFDTAGCRPQPPRHWICYLWWQSLLLSETCGDVEKRRKKGKRRERSISGYRVVSCQVVNQQNDSELGPSHYTGSWGRLPRSYCMRCWHFRTHDCPNSEGSPRRFLAGRIQGTKGHALR